MHGTHMQYYKWSRPSIDVVDDDCAVCADFIRRVMGELICCVGKMNDKLFDVIRNNCCYNSRLYIIFFSWWMKKYGAFTVLSVCVCELLVFFVSVVCLVKLWIWQNWYELRNTHFMLFTSHSIKWCFCPRAHYSESNVKNMAIMQIASIKHRLSSIGYIRTNGLTNPAE